MKTPMFIAVLVGITFYSCKNNPSSKKSHQEVHIATKMAYDKPISITQRQLDSLVKAHDWILLKVVQKFWDKDFDDAWVLKDASSEEIDHSKNGYVLTWQQMIGKTRIIRRYSFDLECNFVSAHEERFQNDSLLSLGFVTFKNKRIQYISQGVPVRSSLKFTNDYLGWDFDVDYYCYEIYHNGRLNCIYKTKYLNDYSMLFERSNKERVDLISGEDCLQLKTK